MAGKKIAPFISFKNDDVINCFGIQPIFSQNGEITRSDVFTIKRDVNLKSDKVTGFKYLMHNDLDEINSNLLPYSATRKKLLSIVSNTRNFYWPETIDDFVNLPLAETMKQLKAAASSLYFFNKTHIANRFITSNKKLYEKIKFRRNILQYDKALTAENELPDNYLILCCKGLNIANNGIIVCPVIDRDHYLEWLDIKGISDDIEIDYKAKYPLMKKWAEIYRHYEMYLNENIPPRWYVSIDAKWHRHYMALIFKK